MGGHTVLLLLFSIVSVQTGSSRVTRHRPRRLNIACEQKDAVIYSVDVTSVSSAKQCCVGTTQQTDALNCYWKSKCSINFPIGETPLPTIFNKPCSECRGSTPNYLARCFTKTPYQAIVDVCDETEDDAGSLSLDVDSGIVRSHPKYPWQYSSNSYYKFSKMFPRYVCKKTLWLTKTKTNLLVTVKAVDVNDGDFLNITSSTMGDEVNTETITTNINKVFYGHKSVEFTFAILQGTNGGKGFLICFKRFTTGEYGQSMDACDALMTKQAKIKRRRETRKCRSVWDCPWRTDYLKQVTITRNKPRRLTIACQEKNAVISSIVVTPGSNTKPCCLGSTVFFLTDAYNCYWKSKCWVNVPVDDVTTPKNCQGCTGSTPNYSARCFTKTPTQAIVDICDEAGGVEGSVSIDSGILRSHQDYPWQYNSNSYPKFSKMFPRYVCKKTLWMTKTKTNLLLTIQVVDIAERDFLNVKSVTMNDEVTTETITSNMTNVYFERKSVEFTFVISQGTKGGKGFLICFKRFTTGEYDQSIDACDELMKEEAKVKKRRDTRKCRLPWHCPWRIGTTSRKHDIEKKRGGKKSKLEEDKNGNSELNFQKEVKTTGYKRKSNRGRNKNRKTQI